MAMRIFKRADFEKELQRAGLIPTDIKTATTRLWKAPNGRSVSVPDHADEYPDSVLEDVLRRVGLLYRTSNPSEGRR